MERQQTDRPKKPSRRAALRRLAGAAVAGYVVPEVLFLSAARAESSAASEPSAPPGPSTAFTPSAPAPSGTASSASSAEEGARETCTVTNTQNSNTISISRRDLQRAQEAVEAGYAKPLDQIWGAFTSEYDGKVIGVEFLDRRNNPRYRFRAISKSGRLETVTISAQTGSIQRIVGC
ncbi:MAG TPA: hypothetical protein EYG79_13565 [Rhodobacteraceae bacterium]|nr:hypothetical protein [Paracoccaceae bacterium]